MADHRDGPRGLAFEHNLIHRAITDGAFRAELLANPTAVVNRELAQVNGKLADGMKVHIIEETPWDLYIVLPPKGVGPGSYNPYNIGQAGLGAKPASPPTLKKP